MHDALDHPPDSSGLLLLHQLAGFLLHQMRQVAVDRGELLVFADQVLLEPSQGEVGVDPGKHFLVLERLGDVIHCSQFKPAHFIHGLGQCRHKDDRNIPGSRIFLEMLARLKSVHFRHQHIQEDQVRPGLLEQFQGGFTMLRHQHPESRIFQIIEQHAQVGRVIVDDQDHPFTPGCSGVHCDDSSCA